MTQTDYKIAERRRDDLGNITYAKVRFYEGETSTKDEPDIEGIMRPVKRYRRGKVLKEMIYQPREFKAFAGGNISQIKDLLLFLDKELLLFTPVTPTK